MINITGLVPKNTIIPQIINLSNIHKPATRQQHFDAFNQWVAFKVFLKIALIQYLEQNKQQKMAKTAILDKLFLQRLTSNLPFELSSSQKNTIWDILKEIMI